MIRRDDDLWKREVPARARPWGVFWRDAAAASGKRSRYFATEREADAFIAAVAIERRKPAPDEDAPPPDSHARPKAGTVARYLADWLTDHVQRHNDVATHVSYEQTVRNHITGALGRYRLIALTRPMIKKFYNTLADAGLGLATRRRIHKTLSSALGQAVLDDLMPFNPCAELSKAIRHQDEPAADPEPNPFTAAEAADLLARAHGSVWYEHFLFLHDTGVRAGECAALKWDHVDLETKRARVEVSYSRYAGKDKLPKTHQCRWIDLSDRLVVVLRRWRQQQRKESLASGRPVSAYVFTSRVGLPRRNHSTMATGFARLLKRCEGPTWTTERRDAWRQHTPHDLRDTFATTHLLADYARLPWVSQQLGHRSPSTTQRHYYKFLPSTGKSFASLIAQG